MKSLPAGSPLPRGLPPRQNLRALPGRSFWLTDNNVIPANAGTHASVTDLGALLAAYPSLPPEERADVDARVAAREASEPALRAAHNAARRLAALVDAASDPGADLAQRVAARRLGASPPEAERRDRDRAADPALAREAEAVAARLDRLEAEAEDPAARFRRLTGRPLPDLSRHGPAPPEPASSPEAPPSPEPAPAPPGGRRLRRWASAAALLALGYGVLWAASTARATTRELVADLGAVGDDAPRAAAGADALSDARAAVGRARRSTLGLFPRYDAAGLDAAAVALADQARRADAPSWPSQEARLALARVHLYRQRDVEAARVLGALVREGGYRAPAARRMLDFLRAQAPTPHPDAAQRAR